MRLPILLSTLCLTSMFGAACTTEPGSWLDDAVDEAEAGKADELGAYRHYLVWAAPSEDNTGPRYVARAGGSALRCFDGSVSEICPFEASDLVPTLGLRENPDALFDELGDHAMIFRGRLIKTDEDRVYLRASAVTRGITEVTPSPTCHRLRYRSDGAYDLELLDTATVEQRPVLFFDGVDPTPDFWGQPTAAVQELIDDALELAKSRPVYACGVLDRRDSGDLFWADQVFAPAR